MSNAYSRSCAASQILIYKNIRNYYYKLKLANVMKNIFL